MARPAAKGGRSPGPCRPGRRRVSGRRCSSTPKLASGHIGRHCTSRRGIDRCKSLKAPGIPARRGGSCVRPLFHRWYQPGTGRYTRIDPLGIRQGEENPYLYGQGNPLTFIDSLGLVAWRCSVIEVSGGGGFVGAFFFVDCDSGCVNGQRADAQYFIAAGGLGAGVTVPVEAGAWTVEDGTDSPDPGNLEGPFSYRGCSITIGIGPSGSEVNMGKGHGSFSGEASFGLGLGCQVITGGSKLTDSREGCCLDGPGPIIRAR